MVVQFQDSNKKRSLIASFDEGEMTPSEARERAFKAIHDFLDERGYTAYYYNITSREDETRVDVGSYTEFFYICPPIQLEEVGDR